MIPISSPCVKLCVVDAQSGLCEGCGRTLAEIAAWGRMSEPTRLALMAALPDRMEAAFGASLAEVEAP
jgi:predicted Fe-S protein YdhL (DUF1289 family)